MGLKVKAYKVIKILLLSRKDWPCTKCIHNFPEGISAFSPFNVSLEMMGDI